MSDKNLRDWYPERVAFNKGMIDAAGSDLHKLYFEECGNPEGKPVLWFHGGPGSGIFGKHGRQFDPEYYRIVLFDQRGAGQSIPFADTRENTTQDLIADAEKIREHLGIDKWAVVAGRSWGSTMSTLYAQAHPERVESLLLIAMFLCDRKANQWLFQEGASHIYPEAWEGFTKLIPPEERHDMFGAYQKRIFGDDKAVAEAAAQAWSTWEANTLSVRPDQSLIDDVTTPAVTLSIARLECHYLRQGGFIEEGQILRDAHKIAHIPTTIVHGRYDMNCQFDNAYRLHNALPNSKLMTVDVGGHAANDPETVHIQVMAADALKKIEHSPSVAFKTAKSTPQ